MSDKINTVSETVDKKDDRAADLDQALAVAGKYSCNYSFKFPSLSF